MGCGGRVASPLVHDKGYYHSYCGANAPKGTFRPAAAEGRCHPQGRSAAKEPRQRLDLPRRGGYLGGFDFPVFQVDLSTVVVAPTTCSFTTCSYYLSVGVKARRFSALVGVKARTDRN